VALLGVLVSDSLERVFFLSSGLLLFGFGVFETFLLFLQHSQAFLLLAFGFFFLGLLQLGLFSLGQFFGGFKRIQFPLNTTSQIALEISVQRFRRIGSLFLLENAQFLGQRTVSRELGQALVEEHHLVGEITFVLAVLGDHFFFLFLFLLGFFFLKVQKHLFVLVDVVNLFI